MNSGGEEPIHVDDMQSNLDEMCEENTESKKTNMEIMNQTECCDEENVKIESIQEIVEDTSSENCQSENCQNDDGNTENLEKSDKLDRELKKERLTDNDEQKHIGNELLNSENTMHVDTADLELNAVDELIINPDSELEKQNEKTVYNDDEAGFDDQGKPGIISAIIDSVNQKLNNPVEISTEKQMENVTNNTETDYDVIIINSPKKSEIVSLVAAYRSDSSDSYASSSSSSDSDSDTGPTPALPTKRFPRFSASSEDDEPKKSGAISHRTKGELMLHDLPPIEDLCITVSEDTPLVNLGKVRSIVGVLVVVQAEENSAPLDEESVLFTADRTSLGKVFETFGPVKAPFYSIRFSRDEQIKEKGVHIGMDVFCAPSVPDYTHFVFISHLKQFGGSDASWENNNEPPAWVMDYSDDEQERKAKKGDGRSQKNKSRRNRNKTDSGQKDETWPPEEDRTMPTSKPKPSHIRQETRNRGTDRNSNWSPGSGTGSDDRMPPPYLPSRSPVPRFGADPIFRPYGPPPGIDYGPPPPSMVFRPHNMPMRMMRPSHGFGAPPPNPFGVHHPHSHLPPRGGMPPNMGFGPPRGYPRPPQWH